MMSSIGPAAQSHQIILLKTNGGLMKSMFTDSATLTGFLLIWADQDDYLLEMPDKICMKKRSKCI
jgi:hypothetical protein